MTHVGVMFNVTNTMNNHKKTEGNCSNTTNSSSESESCSESMSESKKDSKSKTKSQSKTDSKNDDDFESTSSDFESYHASDFDKEPTPNTDQNNNDPSKG